MTRDELYAKYPTLFRQKTLGKHESCMYWGIQCGDGWLDLIDNLSMFLSEYDGVEYAQIKEKFGALIVHLDFSVLLTEQTKNICRNYVSEYYALSLTTCEVCGSHGKLRSDLPWITTLCDTHYIEKKDSQKDYMYDGQ